MVWNPQRYEAFADHRMRPAIDLLGRVTLDAPRHIVDLGCGSGGVTLLLAHRWPQASVLALDASAEMLAKARERSGTIDWRAADLASWRPERRYDLVFSNAALHWLDDHPALFRRLADAIAPAGTLAVQMPCNFGAPSHVLMHALALETPYRGHLEAVLRPVPVLEPAAYHALLAPWFGRVDVWTTEYFQVLRGGNPVADWTRSTWLAPLIAALPADLASRFESEYRRRIAQAYPKTADGGTLFPFRRLFMVACSV